jgi:hypothetical protein
MGIFIGALLGYAATFTVCNSAPAGSSLQSYCGPSITSGGANQSQSLIAAAVGVAVGGMIGYMVTEK